MGIIVLLLALCILASSPAAQAASVLTKVVVVYGTLSGRYVPLWLADDQGFFKKYGVSTDLVFVRGASTLMAALASGDVQLGWTGGNPALGGAAGGVEVAIVANFDNRIRVEVMVRPGIKTPQDLRGKRFGLQSFGGTTWLYTLLALEQLGLEPSRDKIQMLVIGDQAVLNRALETGTIDALVLSVSVFSRDLKEKGFTNLGQLNLPIAGVSVVVRKSLIQQQPTIMENLMKAQIEGLAYALSARHKPAVLETIRRRLKVANPRLVEETYRDIVEDLERKPYPSVEGLKNIQRLMKDHNPRLAQIRVEDVIDDRFIRKLDESGFIDRIYASYGVK